MQRLTSTKLFKVILIASFFAFLIFINPSGLFNPIRNVFVDLLSPFQRFGHSVSATVSGAGDFIASIGQLKTENNQLIHENETLKADIAMLTDVKNENEDLRQQLNLLPRSQFSLLSASVIGQDPNGMGNWIEIDRGSDDGIKEGMPVIVSKSILVGKIQDVTANNSKVMLLTNPKSIVNVATTQSGAKGVVKGEYGLGLTFDMILQTDSIQSGNEVVTSGIGSDIPRGLYIGTVQDVHPSDDHLFQQAAIISPLKVSKLQFVFVLLASK